jgi:hypothetical protein
MSKERLLTLIREHYAEDIAHNDRLSQLYSQIAMARARLNLTKTFRLWDVVDLEFANYEREYTRFTLELDALYKVTSPEEFTLDEQREMQTLLGTDVKQSERIMEQLKEMRLWCDEK